MANTREHRYAVSITWNGNLGTGTSAYRDYSRDYEIGSEGALEVGRDGVGQFKCVVLHPTVTVAPGSNIERARTLHKPAHEKCFIANSVNFPVECEPEIVVAG